MEAERGHSAAAFALAAAMLLVAAAAHSPEDYPGSWSQEDHQAPTGICYDHKSRNRMGQPMSVCCDGWKQVTSGSQRPGGDPECQPICSPPCKNSYCTKPGHCDCMEGFIRTSRHECEPLCQPPCVNGDCFAPNRCKCRSGFTQSARSHVCREGSRRTSTISQSPRAPSCQPSCVHASCVSEDACECHAGFERHPTRAWECVPLCRPRCGANERCVAPDRCECVQGYARAHGGSCAPVCRSPCLNGRCVAPDVCECSKGYEEVSEDGERLCVPTCHPPCGPFGECEGVNNCTCYDGFVRTPAGDCIGDCTASERWDPHMNACVSLPSTFNSPSSKDPSSPPPNPTSPRPPPQPRTPPPSEAPPPRPSPPPPQCVPSCARGVCVSTGRGGRCTCEDGWAGAACARPCQAAKGSVMVDTEDCPGMKGCACGAVNRTERGVFCAIGAQYLCGAAAASAVSAASTGAARDDPPTPLLPSWGLWAAAAGAAVVLLLLVAVPSAVALHRRHRRQRREREDDERQRVLQTKGAGGGRLHEVDLGNDWRFTSY